MSSDLDRLNVGDATHQVGPVQFEVIVADPSPKTSREPKAFLTPHGSLSCRGSKGSS
jgi:hypothetical protein